MFHAQDLMHGYLTLHDLHVIDIETADLGILE